MLVCCLNQLAWCAKGTNNKVKLRLTFRKAVSHRHKINDLWSDENSFFFTSSDFRITEVCFCSKRWSPHGIRGLRTVSAHFGSPRYESSFDADLSLCPSKSLSCCTAFSSRVSTTYSTSKTLLVHRLRDRCGRHDGEAFESDAVNVGLIFLRATNVLLPTDLLLARLRRLELQLLRHRSSVGGVLLESSFQTCAKLFTELPVIIPVRGNLCQHVKALFFTRFCLITRQNLFCRRVSRGKFRGRPSGSTPTTRKFNDCGMSSSR